MTFTSSSFSSRFLTPSLLALTLFLGACQTTSDFNPLYDGPDRNARVNEAVDGLIVGHRLMAAGEYELALSEYEHAAVRRGFSADVLSAMGSAQLRLGRVGEAERLLRRAVEKDDRFAAAWNNLGIALVSQGELKEAENTFKLAFALTNGRSDEIKENLIKTMEKIEENAYTEANNKEFDLVRRGNGRYLLLHTPGETGKDQE